METELKNLRIDRTERRARESKPVVQLIVISLVLVAVAFGVFFAYQKVNAAVPVQVVQVQSPMNESAAGEQVILTATGYIVAAHKIEDWRREGRQSESRSSSGAVGR
jgi:HlyD family secretion protein